MSRLQLIFFFQFEDAYSNIFRVTKVWKVDKSVYNWRGDEIFDTKRFNSFTSTCVTAKCKNEGKKEVQTSILIKLFF